MAHELTHHLRHHYGAPVRSDFVEEQVANVVAVAFVLEHPIHRETISPLRELARRAREILTPAAPEALPHLEGFRTELGEVLLAQGELTPAEASGLRLLADALGQPPDEMLERTGLASDVELRRARAERAETAAYFTSHYMSSLFEYWLFHNAWLETYLERNDLPTLGEALEEHILTADWERAQRREALTFLIAGLRQRDKGLAVAAAETLTEEFGREAVRPLLEAAGRAPAPVKAAALRGLRLLAPERAVEAARRARSADDPALRAAAGALLATVGDGRTTAGREILRALLAGDESARRQAIAAVVELGDPSFLPELRAAVAAADPELRALALAALERLPAGEGVGGLAAEALRDPEPAVRRAAAACLRTHATVAEICPLVAALGDEADSVRAAASEALRSLGAPAVAALEAVADTWTHRVEAALLLLALGGPGAEARAKRLIGDLARTAEELVRQREALGEEAPAELLLREALSDERVQLAMLALRLAGALDRNEAVELGLLGLESEREEVRRAGLELVRGGLVPELAPALASLLSWPAASPPAGNPPRLEALIGYPEQVVSELVGEVLAARSPGAGKERKVLTTAEKLMYLRAVPEFRTVPLAALRALSDDLVARRYKAGETLFSQDESDDRLVVVTSGRVVLERRDGGGSRRVGEYHSGQAFGEAALFRSGPRRETARATEETSVLTLRREPFRRLVSAEPRALLEVLAVISERLDVETLSDSVNPARLS
jgi:HEAT repeat protein